MTINNVPPRINPAAESPQQPAEPNAETKRGLASLRHWLTTSGNYYLASMLIHMTLMLLLALVLGVRYVVQSIGSAPAFDPVEIARIETPQLDFNNDKIPEYPDPMAPDGPTIEFNTSESKTKSNPGIGDLNDQRPPELQGGGTPIAEDVPSQLAGSGLSFVGVGLGQAAKELGGIDQGPGTGTLPGRGGDKQGFGLRGMGHGPPGSGDRRVNQQSVTLALMWLAKHQNADGSWSLGKFSSRCQGGSCDGAGSVQSDAAATALGVLPFLARGETHVAKCEYRQTVRAALNWLVTHQAATGDLSAGSPQQMYSHALATIALCEAYGMTQQNTSGRNYDSRLRTAAEAALRFIETAQNAQDGGWRYHPAEAGDTSVVGWQVMALKSAQMAGLPVRQAALDGAKKWLDAAAGGDYGGQFAYQPGRGRTTVMSSVGLLCRQYLGASRQDPGLIEGVRLLAGHLPNVDRERNTYYWYYATQVMHNLMDENWDTWNRKMRRILVETQETQGCAKGSWDPLRPTADAWGAQGGRLMVTSLSCLTLEVYYRYLPLYDFAQPKRTVAK